MSSNNSNDASSAIPSELRISKQWDFAIEQFVTRVSVGFVTAGLASIVLFRSRSPRVGLTMFGAGIGAGD
eukprot:gene46935-57470_t